MTCHGCPYTMTATAKGGEGALGAVAGWHPVLRPWTCQSKGARPVACLFRHAPPGALWSDP